MKRFEKVLFPTDFKSVSQSVTENAFEFARSFSSELHFFHADLLFANDPNDSRHQLPEGAIELGEGAECLLLEDVLAQLTPHNLAIDKHEKRAISAAPAILEFTHQERFDLIVMGTHGRKGVARWWLGSVAEAVLAGADKPMLIIRDGLPIGLFQKINHILAPVYLDAQCQPTLDLALAMAEAFQATLHVLHVIPAEVHLEGKHAPMIFDLPLATFDKLEELVSKHRDLSKVTVCLYSATGSPAQEILERAEALHAGLIVMGHRDRLGFSERLKGGITELVIRDATCPVMTTPVHKKVDLERSLP